MIALYINDLSTKGGTHKQVLHFINYLHKEQRKFKLITSDLDYNKTYTDFHKYKDNIKYIKKKSSSYFFSKIYFNILFIIKLRKELKGYDLLNIHDHGLEIFLPFLYDKKIIWQINDLPKYLSKPINTYFKIFNFDYILTQYLKISTRMSVNLITVNVTKNKQRVKNYLNHDAIVLYCGIEKINAHHDIDESLLRFSLNKINLLSSGVFFPYRNYETQVHVVSQLKEKGYSVKLDIIGATELDPKYALKIVNLVKKNNLQDCINLHGQVSEENLKSLHQNSDVFIFINVDQSWGLAVFEAMSCGLPVIVSNSVGATEILNDEVDSVFVDPKNTSEITNKIIQICTSDRYMQLSTNGIAFANRYTWDEAYSSKLLALIEKISPEL